MNTPTIKGLLIVGAIAALLATLWALRSRDEEPSNGASTERPAPEQEQDGFETDPSLDIAQYSGMLVNSDGRVWMWGARRSFALSAIYTPAEKHRANELRGIDRVVSASVAEGYAMAVRADGSVWGIGSTAGGQMGLVIPDGRTYTAEWMEIPGLKDVAQVVTTYHVSLVLKNDGTVWASGINDWGRLGEDYVGPISRVHVQLAHLSGIRHIDASENHETYYALRDDGKVLVWGRRYSLGLPYLRNARDYLPVPQPIEGLDNVIAIAGMRTSIHRILAQRRDGSVVLWAGDGFEPCEGDRKQMLLIDAFQDAISIAEDPHSVYAVKADGSFWKFPMKGVYHTACKPAEQLLPPGSATAIKISGTSYALLMRDGSVQVWGNTLGLSNHTTMANSLAWEKRETIQGIDASQ